MAFARFAISNLFLSTLSLRRATLVVIQQCFHCLISIHALLAESDRDRQVGSKGFRDFYPRSPCGERHAERYRNAYDYLFLSTLSLRRATHVVCDPLHLHIISIHALLAESDNVALYPAFCASYFYPRSPCGERLCKVLRPALFLPISIHALLAESDRRRCGSAPRRHYFYPRSPCGERPDMSDVIMQYNHISIHALLAESDQKRRKML